MSGTSDRFPAESVIDCQRNEGSICSGISDRFTADLVIEAERNMQLPAVRKVTDFSKRLVQKYHDLYKRYDTGDFIFAMSKIRRFAQANRARPNNRKKGDAKDDDG